MWTLKNQKNVFQFRLSWQKVKYYFQYTSKKMFFKYNQYKHLLSDDEIL